ncbi:MAG: hypothetical protein BGN87_07085 [Rhizobiales bacterium 65-79]|nr:MAG: hypothetical protein BGN87_07085 [Rhizobiales bacterium 65-79]
MARGIADGISSQGVTRIRAVADKLLSARQGADGGTPANEDESANSPAPPLEAAGYSVCEFAWQFRADSLQRLVIANDQRICTITECRITHLALGNFHQLALRAAVDVIEVDLDRQGFGLENQWPPLVYVDADDGS